MKKLSRILILVVLTALLLDSCCVKNINSSSGGREKDNTEKKQVDGPFVLLKDSDRIEIINAVLSKDDVAVDRNIQNRETPFTCFIDNKFADKFSIKLMDSISKNKAIYDKVDRLFVMSDLHGSFNAMYSLLVNNGVIDKKYNWTFGDGHIVMDGDITDRGRNTVPCLWLFYHLEQMAPGKVHYLLGNHEMMTLYGRAAYLNEKTKRSVVSITGKKSKSKALRTLFSEKSELGKWLRTKNTIEKIGDVLFVHAGLSKKLVDSRLTIPQINNVMREYVGVSYKKIPKRDSIGNLLYGRFGPIWYRGMVMDYKNYYKKISQKDFNDILKYFGVKKIIVGHTGVDKVSSDYAGGLIRVNVSQPWEKDSDKAQALLIEGDKYYRVDGLGKRVSIVD